MNTGDIARHPKDNPILVINAKQRSRCVWTSSLVKDDLLDDYEKSSEKESFEREGARNSTEMEQQSWVGSTSFSVTVVILEILDYLGR